MEYVKTKDTYILKITQGENVLDTIVTFCEQEQIKNAYFTGIGAVKDLSCGYYELEEKKYYFTSYPDIAELVSLVGNVAVKEGKAFVHAHGVFTDTQNRAFGGHIEKVSSGIVVEVMLTPLESSVAREYDEHTGLFLMNCGG
jgi:uncharacterized protein